MTEVLREDVFRDTGHPKLKAKCLDLISKLRLESELLNPSKAKSPKIDTPTPEGEAPTLDENG